MFYSTQLRVFLAPGCFIRHEGGRRFVLWVSRMGSRLLHVSKPAGPPQANIKQPEHLFSDSVPCSASAQMKGPESFWLGWNCTKIKDAALFKWWNRMVLNWWMFWGLFVMQILFQSNRLALWCWRHVTLTRHQNCIQSTISDGQCKVSSSSNHDFINVCLSYQLLNCSHLSSMTDHCINHVLPALSWHNDIIAMAMHILQLIVLDNMFKNISKVDLSLSPLAQCWILKSQKCQNFHVVIEKERRAYHRLNFSGLSLYWIPPEKNGPRAIFHFLSHSEKVSA